MKPPAVISPAFMRGIIHFWITYSNELRRNCNISNKISFVNQSYSQKSNLKIHEKSHCASNTFSFLQEIKEEPSSLEQNSIFDLKC